MHEMGIARNILEIVDEEIKLRNINSPVEKIVFRANRINSIFPESLCFLFNAIKEEYEFFKNCSLEIVIDPYSCICTNCHLSQESEEITSVCKNCGSTLKLLSGEEMKVDSFSTVD